MKPRTLIIVLVLIVYLALLYVFTRYIENLIKTEPTVIHTPVSYTA